MANALAGADLELLHSTIVKKLKAVKKNSK